MAKLTTRFKVIGNATTAQAQAALVQVGSDVVQLAQELAPVDTGALRRSYRWEYKEGDPNTIIVGSHNSEINPKTKKPVDYAVYVEFGSYRQPHFMPAFGRAVQMFEIRLKDLVQKIK